MDYRAFLRNNKDIILILAIYFSLAILMLKYYQYNLFNDDISYINIARGYARGEWYESINGYWSPLISFLTTPFLLFNSEPFYALYISKLVSIIIGFFTIIGINRLIKVFEFNKTIKRALLISILPFVLFFSLFYNTPDLLVACVLIYYLSFIFSSNYFNNSYYGILCGLIGALAYFSKSFAFYFFIAHFLLFNLIYYFKELNKKRKRNILRNLVLGFIVFFCISGLWVGAISEKYDKFTISTSGQYNYAFIGPQSLGHPSFSSGLFKPPTKVATSSWDDPSYFKINQWNPLNSWENFQYELVMIWKNILTSIFIIESFLPVAVIVVISSLWFIFKSKSKKTSKEKLSYLLITIGIYLGGYTLIFIEWRYLWLIFFLLIISGFYLIDNLSKNRDISIKFRNIFLILLISSILFIPVYGIITNASNDDSIYKVSNALKNDYGVHGNIASDGNWGIMICTSYFMNAKYYGITKKTNNSADLQRELENNNIDYYFIWETSDDLQLTNYSEMNIGKNHNFRIYSKKLNST